MTGVKFALYESDCLGITKFVPRHVGIFPSEDETTIRRTKPASKHVVECVEISTVFSIAKNCSTEYVKEPWKRVKRQTINLNDRFLHAVIDELVINP